MKRIDQIKTGLLALFVAGIFALSAVAADRKVKLGDCPAAVQQAIRDNAGGSAVGEVETETRKDGTIVYEAEVKKADGTEVEITVAEDGRLISVEVEDDNDEDDDD